MQASFKISEIIAFSTFVFSYARNAGIREDFDERYPALQNQDLQKSLKRLGEALSEERIIALGPMLQAIDDLKAVVPEAFRSDFQKAFDFYLHEHWHPMLPKLKAYQKEIIKDGSVISSDLTKAAQFLGVPAADNVDCFLMPFPGGYSNGFAKEGFIGLGVHPDKKRDRIHDKSIITHEMVHVLFQKFLNERVDFPNPFSEKNPVVDYFKAHPEAKRPFDRNAEQEAQSLFDETLATAFQGIVEEKETGKLPSKPLYQNFLIDKMARRMIPVVKDYLAKDKQMDAAFVEVFKLRFKDQTNQKCPVVELACKGRTS